MSTEYLGFQLRPATTADNQALIDMTASAPMPGKIRMYLERSPDFFVVPRLMDGTTETDVAVSPGSEVTGVQTMTLCRRYYKGREIPVMHWGDLRVIGNRQGGKAGSALILRGKERLIESGAHLATAEVLEGNAGARNIIKRISALEPVNEVVSGGNYEIHQILPLRSLHRLPRGSTVRRATPDDLETICSLLNEFYQDYFAVPRFDREFFTDLFARSPGLDIGAFRILERNGVAEACSGLWDQNGFRRTVVEKTGRAKSLLRSLHPVVRAPLGLIPLPPEGGSFVQMKACFFACRRGRERSLRDLIRHMVRETRNQGKAHFLQIAFHEREPALAALKGLLRLMSRTEIYYYLPVSRKKERFFRNEDLPALLPWAEFSIS